jgi:hypothetical protein
MVEPTEKENPPGAQPDAAHRPAAQPPEGQPAKPPRSRLRRALVNLGLVAGGGLFALLIAEIVLRLLFYFPQPQFLLPDDIVGHRLRPGIRGYYVEEGFSRYTINSHGLRDREYPLAKPPGTFRIAVLGDSYTEALQVELEQTFHERLEHSLEGVEVLSFGVSGYGTAQELLMCKQYARPFHPDLVLLAATPANDVADNSRALSGGYPRPYFELRDGRLVLDDSFRRSRRHLFLKRWGWLYYFATDHSALAERIDRWRRTAMTRARYQRNAAAQHADAPLEPGLARGLYGPPATPELRGAWAVTERLLLELQTAVENDGATLALVLTTTAAQVDPKQRDATRREHPDWDLDYPDTRIASFAREHRIACLALAPALLEFGKKGIPIHGFGGQSRGHWNAEGHRLAAQEIREFLIGGKLVSPNRR